MAESEQAFLDSEVRPIREVDEAVQHGEQAVDDGKFSNAGRYLRHALFLMGTEQGQRRAEVYQALAGVHTSLGKPAHAVSEYEKALANDPDCDAAWAGISEALLDASDFQYWERLQLNRLATWEGETSREGEGWLEVARVWQDRAQNWRRSVAPLNEALERLPQNEEVAERLGEAFNQLGETALACSTWVDLAQKCDGVQRRVELLLRAATISISQLGNAEQGVQLAELALNLDAESEKALATIETVLIEDKAWERLGSAYEEVVSGADSLKLLVSAGQKLARLLRDQLGDIPRAIRAFEVTLGKSGEDIEMMFELLPLYEANDQPVEAVTLLRRVIQLEPRQHAAYHRLSVLATTYGDPDTAWRCSAILNVLAKATPEEKELAAHYRPESLPAVWARLSPEDWPRYLIRSKDGGPSVAPVRALLELVGPAVIRWKLEQKAAPDHPAFKKAQAHPLAGSTTMLARSLSWTSEVLGVPVPKLWTGADMAGQIVHVRSSDPELLVCRSLASGYSLVELAFLWARVLNGFRLEYRVCNLISGKELTSWLLAALSLSSSGRGHVPFLDAEATRIAKSIRRKLDPKVREQIVKLEFRLEPEQILDAIVALSAEAELTSNRVAFLVSGDLEVAAGLMKRFPRFEMPYEQQLDDLYVYGASERCTRARSLLGVALTPA